MPKFAPKTAHISVRAEQDLTEQIEAIAVDEGRKTSDVVCRLLREAIAARQSNR